MLRAGQRCPLQKPAHAVPAKRSKTISRNPSTTVCQSLGSDHANIIGDERVSMRANTTRAITIRATATALALSLSWCPEHFSPHML
ncbi:hypothetical protein HGM15179_008157 [Zosterops borbonicus]|uniref:Uncharacterized protein n=1 Tax=Zosterops borbonicus TaxID=364589 RepID=A0A8K1LM74_9PASS|nr:hypothetical protein HGM15179_008157 [Zosterops borbonicus]